MSDASGGAEEEEQSNDDETFSPGSSSSACSSSVQRKRACWTEAEIDVLKQAHSDHFLKEEQVSAYIASHYFDGKYTNTQIRSKLRILQIIK